MADDQIDIEEHDVLDNPLVRKMFPDLSIIKKEAIDFNDEEPAQFIPQIIKVTELRRNDNKIIKEETDAIVSSSHSNPTDKIISITCSNNDTEQEINMGNMCNRSVLHGEVQTKSPPMETSTSNNPKLSPSICGKRLATKIVYEQEGNGSNIKTYSAKVPKALKKTTVFLKNQCQDRKTPEENSNSRTVSSACVNKQYIENGELDQRKQSVKGNVSDSPVIDSVFPLNANKILIGSKKSESPNCKQNFDKFNMSRNVNVKLENINIFLSKSTRYCRICCRLFPSNKTLADHQNLIHTQSQDNQSCESVKKRVFTNHNKRYKCDICEVVCSSSGNLSRHKRVVHLTYNKSARVKTRSRKHNIKLKSQYNLNITKKKIKCTHCNNSYASQKLLIDHMYNVLQTKKKDISKYADNPEGKRREKEDKGNLTKMFYKCSFCSYFFQKQNIYISHMNDVHKYNDEVKLEKVAYNSVCELCCNKYRNVKSFNAHVTKYHRKRLRKYKVKQRTKQKNIAKKSQFKEQTIKSKEKIRNNLSSTLPNSEQCTISKFERECNKNEGLSTMTNSEEQPKKLYLLKSALFKCLKCDICFLSGNKAAAHVNHMDILINWKCLICLKIFKEEDKLLHNQQHLFTDIFDVYEIRDTSNAFVLYKCPNCTTFFLEKDFFNHYSICETQSPDSAYCKICHILIDNKIKDSHDEHHNNITDNLKLNNLFVESDVITYIEENDKGENLEHSKILKNENDLIKTINDKSFEPLSVPKLQKKRNKFTKNIPSFTFCNTCRCFVRRTQNLYYHTKGRCSNHVKYVCRYCGLVLTSKSINFHRKLHQDVPGLTIHDFKFYDMYSNKAICPPVPKYPSCEKCRKHFITKTAIISHQCGEDYLTCPVCKIKLSNTALPLHMSFHKYLRKNRISSIPDVAIVTDLPSKSKPHLNLLNSNKNEENNQLLVYVCKICKIALDIYDKVIEHCQDHISRQEKEINTEVCESCNLIFDVTCFDNHNLIHASNHDKKFAVLSFDVFYATAENNIWHDHLFGSISKKVINNILGNSIYKFERRIKMKILQNGLSHFTFYKCAKCEKMIDSSSLYKHCQLDVLCTISKGAKCSFCEILLVSEEYRIEHEKIHKQPDITANSYRIVLFNSDEDKLINSALSLPNQYVLYECRNCNGIVDKDHFQTHKCDNVNLVKCSHCGLLLCTNDYMSHVLKHKEFVSFNESNMKVILIGSLENGNKFKSRMIPSFRGTRLDYLLYQCNKCQVCVKGEENSLIHECAMDTAKTKCLICDLYFDDSLFKNHRKFHESNSYYLKENIKVVKFGGVNSKACSEDVIVIEDDGDLENIPDNTLEVDKFNGICDNRSEIVVEKSDEIFKCSCGLHFLNKELALSHHKTCNKSSSDKQMCSKCGLAFLPNVLYSHLLAHHGTKNISYKFNVIEIS